MEQRQDPTPLDGQSRKGSLSPCFSVDGEGGEGLPLFFGCWEEKRESGKDLYHGESRYPISIFGQGAATSGKKSESYLIAS